MIKANMKSIPLRHTQKASNQRLRVIHRDQPRSTKKPRTIVPPPQSARITQRYINGESIRQIARDEKRDRATVTKIVRSVEMQLFVQKMREKFYGLAFDAMTLSSTPCNNKTMPAWAIGYSAISESFRRQEKDIQSLHNLPVSTNRQ
jgi:hypothetical protein